MSLRRHRDYDRSAFGLHTHGPFTHPTLSGGIKVFIALSDTAAGQSCSALRGGSVDRHKTHLGASSHSVVEALDQGKAIGIFEHVSALLPPGTSFEHAMQMFKDM